MEEKITDEIKNLIMDWLIERDEKECPFGNIEARCEICKSLFKRLPYEGDPSYLVCPCNAYSKSYVVKRAKDFVRDK